MLLIRGTLWVFLMWGSLRSVRIYINFLLVWNESEKKCRRVGLFEDVVFGYVMSEASVQVIEKCLFVQEYKFS